MASSLREGKETMEILREQIFANAAIVFSPVVTAHLETHGGALASPKDVFDIVINELADDNGCQSRSNYKAILVYGTGVYRKTAATSAPKAGMDAALESLLILLASRTDPKRMLFHGLTAAA